MSELLAVFGELSALLDQPHTADVRALETSKFHVADAALLLNGVLVDVAPTVRSRTIGVGNVVGVGQLSRRDDLTQPSSDVAAHSQGGHTTCDVRR